MTLLLSKSVVVDEGFGFLLPIVSGVRKITVLRPVHRS